jgi:hypothetical protein
LPEHLIDRETEGIDQGHASSVASLAALAVGAQAAIGPPGPRRFSSHSMLVGAESAERL